MTKLPAFVARDYTPSFQRWLASARRTLSLPSAINPNKFELWLKRKGYVYTRKQDEDGTYKAIFEVTWEPEQAIELHAYAHKYWGYGSLSQDLREHSIYEDGWNELVRMARAMSNM